MKTLNIYRFWPWIMQRHTLLFVLVALTQLACSSDSSTPTSGMTNDGVTLAPAILLGNVMDSVSGEAIRGATVRTDPPSEEVVTDIDGEFVLAVSQTGGDPVRVIASHFAYLDAQTEVIALPGTDTQVNFALQSSAIGLHASASILQFEPTEVRKSLRLSSNLQNTGFFTITTDPWVRVTPSQGVIANRETAVLQIQIDPDLLPAQRPAQSELVINSDNGTRELIITIIVNGPADVVDAPDSFVNARQNDCRIPEVFRVGQNNPQFPLVQFPPSVLLPDDAGPRFINTAGNPFLVDSIAVKELGAVTITHSDGGPTDTTLVLFELDNDDNYVALTNSTGVSSSNLRASITDWALTAGVYCYYLSGTDLDFDQAYDLRIDIEFTVAQ
ncbi:MAG: carboxypeptidase-like regulatory domain-containing protein [Granulosicoccus sp.]